MNDVDRIAALEERVAELERGAARGGVSPSPGVGDLWVLEGLTERLAGGSGVVYAGVLHTDRGPWEWQIGHLADDLLDADAETVRVRSERLGALGHPARLAILAAVLRGHDRVGELGELLDLGTSGQVYHHVKALTAAGWLRSAARGRVEVPGERVVPVLVAMGVGA